MKSLLIAFVLALNFITIGYSYAACPTGYTQASEGIPMFSGTDQGNLCRALASPPNDINPIMSGTFCNYCSYTGCPSGTRAVLNAAGTQYTCEVYVYNGGYGGCSVLGQKRCIEPGITNERETCNNAGEWLPSNCTSGQICTGAGTCTPPNCPSGQTWNGTSCVGGTVACIGNDQYSSTGNAPCSSCFTTYGPGRVANGTNTGCVCDGNKVLKYCGAGTTGTGATFNNNVSVCGYDNNSCQCAAGYSNYNSTTNSCSCTPGVSCSNDVICSDGSRHASGYTCPASTTVCSCPPGYTSTPPAYTNTYTISSPSTCGGTVASRCYAPCSAKPTNSSWNAGNGSYQPNCAYTCSAGLTGTNCDVCTNGATNPGACSVCPVGKIMYSGTCTDPTPLAPTANVWAKVVIATTTAAKANPTQDPTVTPMQGISIATVNYGNYTTDATGRTNFLANSATGFSIRPNMTAYANKGTWEAFNSLSSPKGQTYESQIPGYDCKLSGPTDTDVLRKYFCYDKYSGNAVYQNDIKTLDKASDNIFVLGAANIIVFTPNAPQIAAPSQSVAYNTPATLTWTGNATAGTVISNWSLSCSGLPTQTGTSASGTYTTPNLTANKTCTLTGSDEWGQPFSVSIPITVGTASAPVLTSLLVATPYSTTPSANSWTKAGAGANSLVLTGTSIYPNTICTVTLTNGSGTSTYVIDNATTPNGASGDEFSGNTYSWPASSIASFGSDTTWSVVCSTAGQNSNTVTASLLVISPATIITTGPTINTIPLSATCPTHTDYYKLYRTVPTPITMINSGAFTSNPIVYTASGLTNNTSYSYRIDCLMGGQSGTIIESATLPTATTNCTNIGETYDSMSGTCKCPTNQVVVGGVCKWDPNLSITASPQHATTTLGASQLYTVQAPVGWVCGMYGIGSTPNVYDVRVSPTSTILASGQANYTIPAANLPQTQAVPPPAIINGIPPYDYPFQAKCINTTPDSGGDTGSISTSVYIKVPSSSLTVQITTPSPIITGLYGTVNIGFRTNGDVCKAYTGTTEITGTTFTPLPTSNNAIVDATATLPVLFTSTSGDKPIKIECSRVVDPGITASDTGTVRVMKDLTATISSVYSGPYTNGNFITSYKCEDSANWELFKITPPSTAEVSVASSTGNVNATTSLHYSVPNIIPAKDTKYKIVCRNSSGVEKSAYSSEFDIANAYPRMLRFDTVPDRVNDGSGEDKIVINYQIQNPINCSMAVSSGPGYSTAATPTQSIMNTEVGTMQSKVEGLFRASTLWDKLNYPLYISGQSGSRTIENVAIKYRKVFTLTCPKHNPADPNTPIMDTRTYTTQILGQGDQ